MSLHITKNSIRATGSDANSLFVALMSDQQLLDSRCKEIGSPEFQQVVKNELSARGYKEPTPPSGK